MSARIFWPLWAHTFGLVSTGQGHSLRGRGHQAQGGQEGQVDELRRQDLCILFFAIRHLVTQHHTPCQLPTTSGTHAALPLASTRQYLLGACCIHGLQLAAHMKNSFLPSPPRGRTKKQHRKSRYSKETYERCAVSIELLSRRRKAPVGATEQDARCGTAAAEKTPPPEPTAATRAEAPSLGCVSCTAQSRSALVRTPQSCVKSHELFRPQEADLAVHDVRRHGARLTQTQKRGGAPASVSQKLRLSCSSRTGGGLGRAASKHLEGDRHHLLPHARGVADGLR